MHSKLTLAICVILPCSYKAFKPKSITGINLRYVKMSLGRSCISNLIFCSLYNKTLRKQIHSVQKIENAYQFNQSTTLIHKAKDTILFIIKQSESSLNITEKSTLSSGVLESKKLHDRVNLQMHQALEHCTERACCIFLTSPHLILLFVPLF